MDGKQQLHCCFKKCKEGGALDARVEVKTVLPTSGLTKTCKAKFLVKWKPSGEAEFHIPCWEEVYALSTSRSKKSALQGSLMTKEEATLVKVAAEAPEQFDTVEAVLAGARKTADWIKQAQHCVAFTGAGISTSAGIGDYRGKAGKWTTEDQNQAVDVNAAFDEGTSRADDDDDGGPPSKKRRVDDNSTEPDIDEEDGVPYEKLRPTYTHEALVKLMELGYLKYIISQNGDGLHGLSGVPDHKISELHGNVFVEVCEQCGQRYLRPHYVLDDVGSQYYEELEDYGKTFVKKPKFAKKCDRCGLSHRTGRKCEKKGCSGYLKDSIINFRDHLEGDVLSRAKANARQSDVMVCLGTTLQVTPAANLVSKRNNRNKLIICNRQETALDDQFKRKGIEDSRCRVFGDCDIFMKEVMRNVLSEFDVKHWEDGRRERLNSYDKLRE